MLNESDRRTTSGVHGRHRRQLLVATELALSMVLDMVLREAGAVVAVGLAAGLLGAFALTRLMRGLLYEVSATDAANYTAVAALLAAAAIVASLVAARQAASVDPVSTMREG